MSTSLSARLEIAYGRRLRFMFEELQYRRTSSSGDDSVDRWMPTSEVKNRMRIAVLATPRSSNSWTRTVLEQSLDLVPVAVHHPADLDWFALPERLVVQLHWRRSPYFQSLLEQAGVKVVTIIRHPFDIMLSVLRFAQTEPATAEWLWGAAGNENILLDADPTSLEFARWAVSERAAALLDVSRSWASNRGTVSVRYEKLISSPEQEFSHVMEALGAKERRPLADTLETYTPERFNQIAGKQHAWLATSGMWQELFTTELVDLLLSRYGDHLQATGYSTEPGGVADREEVRRRWTRLSAPITPLAGNAYEASH
jgi:hypothetical protein